MRASVIAALCFLVAGCGGDGGGDAGMASADASSDGGGSACTAGPPLEARFSHAGSCFDQTPRCCADSDCDPALYQGCILERGGAVPGFPALALGHCQAWDFCTCASDGDCPEGAICVTNQRVCGVCLLPAPAACDADVDCDAEETCVEGRCSPEC